MITCASLQIDRGDGLDSLQYRIEDGRVEMRVLSQRGLSRSGRVKEWLKLTTEQLTYQVGSNPVLARWLLHRMGVRRLLRACAQFDIAVPFLP